MDLFLASPLSVAINGDAIGVGGGIPGDVRYRAATEPLLSRY